MRTAELLVLAKRTHRKPFLLLDDVSSELDRARTEQLFDLVRELDVQTFVTTTDDSIATMLGPSTRWRVQAGTVAPANANDEKA